MKRAYCLLLLLSSLMCVGPVSAALDLELTQGVSGAQPIAIIPFVGQDRYIDDEDHSNLTTIITADLQNSGRFRVLAPTSRQAEPVVNYSHWRKRGADTLVQGELTTLPLGDLKVQISLHDLFRNKKAKPGQQQLIFEKEYTVPATQLRALAHKISDEIYQALTGDRGVFSTRIAYVLVKRQPGVPTKYILEVADADGYKPTALLVSHEPIMSPAWSSDGKRLAYVSFEQGRSQVYVADVATGARRMVADYPGINGAPSWSPDGRSLAIVLSKTGHPKIFTVDVNSKQLRQITKGWSIDTEPSWAPDGNSIVFTSDRGGSPQIYQVAIDDGKVTRLTFRGNYNARASYMPGGENIVLLTRRKGQFNIGMLDVKTGNIQLLTNAGLNESPSISPNGRMILYGTQYGGNGVLGVVSSDGRVKLRLPSHFGDVQEPAGHLI